ncbi:MAG: sugar transferase [Phycisphaerales bacterium]|nr:sugar transferase [Phycisphaerales bacterium]
METVKDAQNRSGTMSMSEGRATLPKTFWTRGGKRALDLVSAVLLLVVFSPILLVAALLIKLTSRGPVFFIQERAGKDGTIFRLIKFRTMRGNRRPDPKELVPLEHPDITRVGRVLRRVKIDELPQLRNVLRGEMSLVGPRPTLPDQVAAYDGFRRQRLLMRPGVTGLAQVYSSASAPWDERILYDIAYVRSCSARLDAAILLRTLLVTVIGEARTARPFATTRFTQLIDLSEPGVPGA